MDINGRLTILHERESMKFAEWCRDNYVREGNYYDDNFTNNWESRSETRIFTTEQLWKLFQQRSYNNSSHDNTRTCP